MTPDAVPETTAANAPNGPGAHYVIVCTLEKDANGEHCVPQNIPKIMHPGDIVTYESPNGEVEITFEQDSKGSGHTSPYFGAPGDLTQVEGGVMLNVKNRGEYFGHCALWVLLPNGEKRKVEWGNTQNSGTQKSTPWNADATQSGDSQPGDPLSGGNHVVI